MKRCPYCAETIQFEAVVCRYCHHQQPAPTALMVQAQQPQKLGLITRYFRWMRWGSLNHRLQCQQCGSAGHVRAKRVRRKKGVSGGKAMGALLTGGLSMLATGLSRVENLTQAHCEYCTSTWDF